MDRPLNQTTLNALGTFGCLRELRLVQQHIQTLEFVGVCKSLQVLHLPENQIERLEGVQSCKFLEELDLSGNLISDLGSPEEPLHISASSPGTQKSPLEGLNRLHTLRLNSNKLRTLRGIEYLVNLKDLQVADNELTHVGAALSNNKNLEKLNIAANL
ncbi:hypothetical protein ENH_00001390 [Eimeria necatrix]|uniref:Leucine rich repeat protein n=1 Tax=Eimeria necatrix TaxID=51315 RepID=U6MK73_9EIME|nr:hypothetical protein ENH_00001390 [Eimeria necatrix]CDJ62020.1 hypothetical protein ENH_00001390 [Eimeria necatrix]